MPLKVIDTGISSAQENMDFDGQLLQELKQEDDLLIHFYEFKSKAATYGHFIKPDKFFCLDAVKKQELDLAKRPTGGGVIFHLTDFTFSLFIPKNHPLFTTNIIEGYSRINHIVIAAAADLLNSEIKPSLFDVKCPKKQIPTFCMAQPTIYDLMIEEKKVGGAAQRRGVAGILHQSSILLSFPPEELIETLLLPSQSILLKEMERWSTSFSHKNLSLKELCDLKKELKNALFHKFNNM